MNDILLKHEDWRNCPVIYRRGGTPPSVVIGEIVPKPKPSLDTSVLLALGYREVGKNELARVGLTKARRPMYVIDLWYIDTNGSPRHCAGFGSTARAAYRDAWRLRRQVSRHGSRVAAAEYGRARIKARAFMPVYALAG